MHSQESVSPRHGAWHMCFSRKMSRLSRSGTVVGLAMVLIALPPFVNTAYADCASDRQLARDVCQTNYEGQWNAAATQYDTQMQIIYNNGVTCGNNALAGYAAALIGCGVGCIFTVVAYPVCMTACALTVTAATDAIMLACINTRTNEQNNAAITRNAAQAAALAHRDNVCYVNADTAYDNCMAGG